MDVPPAGVNRLSDPVLSYLLFNKEHIPSGHHIHNFHKNLGFQLCDFGPIGPEIYLQKYVNSFMNLPRIW
jgi:hypothetical protein